MQHASVLDLWRRNVGDDVALQLAQPAHTPLSGLHVLCWNLAVGRARLPQLLHGLLDGRITGDPPRPDRPLVILAQEAYRADASVPLRARTHHHGGLHPRDPRCDIVALAREFGLSLCYSPSMRNGQHRSDRGNAVLATAALESMHTFSLPFARQRRVVVVCGVVGVPGLRLASAHLDTLRQLRTGTPSRIRQAAALASELRADNASVLLGADLNSWFGELDPIVQALVRGGFRAPSRQGVWRHTYHGTGLRLLVDHVLHVSGSVRWQVRVRRLDEARGDRRATIFGSDHHPLLAVVDFES